MNLALGPLRYRVEGHEVLEAWHAFDGAPAPRARRVVVSRRSVQRAERPAVRPGTPLAVVGDRFEILRRDDLDEVYVDVSAPDDVPFRAALAALVTLDGPARGLIVVHAGGVHVGGGVVALVGRSGVGKSTRVMAVGTAAFAFNALLVEPSTRTAWPLPFAGPGDPPCATHEAAPLRGIALLERSERAFLEPIGGARATVPVVKSIVHLGANDPAARLRAELALELMARVPVVRLGSPPDAEYLPLLNAWACGSAEAG